MKLKPMKSKPATPPLVHFALRTEASTIAELEELADIDQRKLRTVASMALKEGAKVLRKKWTSVKR